MLFADFILALQGVWAMTFPFSATTDVSIGQLVIWTIVLGVGLNFGKGLIRG